MNDHYVNTRHDTRRRQTLILLGAAGTGMLAYQAQALTVPACVVTPAQTEGPFFVDDRLNRSDLRTDPATGSALPGAPLVLALRVSAVTTSACTPLARALVDVWHCDAAGVYSGTADAPSARFLRGQQATDVNGASLFMTIYPGWYPGRAVHIHFKVRARTTAGHTAEFTSQIYFDDAVTDRVLARQPYAVRDGRHRVRNAADGIYRQDGRQLLATLAESSAGYAAAFDIGLRI